MTTVLVASAVTELAGSAVEVVMLFEMADGAVVLSEDGIVVCDVVLSEKVSLAEVVCTVEEVVVDIVVAVNRGVPLTTIWLIAVSPPVEPTNPAVPFTITVDATVMRIYSMVALFAEAGSITLSKAGYMVLLVGMVKKHPATSVKLLPSVLYCNL